MLILALFTGCVATVLETRSWTVPTYALGGGGGEGFYILVDQAEYEQEVYDFYGSGAATFVGRHATVLWCDVLRDAEGTHTTCAPVLSGDEAEAAEGGPRTFHRLTGKAASRGVVTPAVCEAIGKRRAEMAAAGVEGDGLPRMPSGCDE